MLSNKSFPRYPRNISGLGAGQFNQTVNATGDVIATFINVTVKKITDGFESIKGMLNITGDQTINGNLTIVGTLDTSSIISPIPPGIIIPYCGNPSILINSPNKWLLCDGSSYFRSEYPTLFNVIGKSYGSNNENEFNVPDLRGRVGVGADPNANVVSSSNTLGDTGGLNNHLLSISELPSHAHTGTTDTSGDHNHFNFNINGTSNLSSPHQHTPFTVNVPGNHNHTIKYGITPVVTAVSGPSTNIKIVNTLNSSTGINTDISIQSWSGNTIDDGSHIHSADFNGVTETDGTHTHTIITNPSGGTRAHNNLQPNIVINYFIKS